VNDTEGVKNVTDTWTFKLCSSLLFIFTEVNFSKSNKTT
jgi:hypothetical protein